MIGKKYKKPHVHYGINLDQSIRFVKPRGELVTISREVKIKKGGKTISKLEREEITYKSGKPGARLTFDVIIDIPTKTIEVKLRELTLSEK